MSVQGSNSNHFERTRTVNNDVSNPVIHIMIPVIPSESDSTGDAYRKKILGQVNPPLLKEEVKILMNTITLPWMLMSNGKIVKYNISAMKVWKSIIQGNHSILGNQNVYNLLGMLTVICMATFALVYCTGMAKSIDYSISVFSRVQTLLSFVLAGYVSLSVQRWDKLRNDSFGKLWGALESLIVYACDLAPGNGDTDIRMKSRLLRYCRLLMRLTFYGARGTDDLSGLVGDVDNEFGALLTQHECNWLMATSIGSRHFIVSTWMKELVYKLIDLDGGNHHNALHAGYIADAFSAIRSGIGAVLGTLGCPLPFMYVHSIFWIVQIALFILAVETGVILAVLLVRADVGNNQFQPNDYQWPLSPPLWYINAFLQLTFQNMIFAIFTEGLLLISCKLSNPFADNPHGFPELAYDAYLFNNCRAIIASHATKSFVLDEYNFLSEKTPDITVCPDIDKSRQI